MPSSLLFGLSLGRRKVGIASFLAAQLLDTTGANVGSPLTTGFIDQGAGFYQWNDNLFPDNFQGAVRFYDTRDPSTALALVPINPQEFQSLTVRSIWSQLFPGNPGDFPSNSAGGIISQFVTGRVLYSNPVSSDPDNHQIRLVAGLSYTRSEGRPLQWTDPGGNWPDLVGAQIFFKFASVPGVQNRQQRVAQGLPIVPSGGLKIVQVDLYSTTSNVDPGYYNYLLTALMPTTGNEIALAPLGSQGSLQFLPNP